MAESRLPSRKAETLDFARRIMAELLTEKYAARATGRFGVIITLDRGHPTKVVELREATVKIDN